MPPQHEANRNIPVWMSSDRTPHPSSDWAIEPHILEPGVMAARTLLSDGHEEMVAHVCNYSGRPYSFKADSFLGLAESVVHITGADSKAVGSSLATASGLSVSSWSGRRSCACGSTAAFDAADVPPLSPSMPVVRPV